MLTETIWAIHLVHRSASYSRFFEKTDFSYNPSVDGTIVNILFQIDLQTADDMDQVFFFLKDSSGGGSARGFTDIATDGSWQTITSPIFTQSDFALRDFSGSLDLTFGFGYTSTADVNLSDVFYSINADNFSVTINTIPEPSSTIGLMFLGFMGLRRRRLRFHQRN